MSERVDVRFVRLSRWRAWRVLAGQQVTTGSECKKALPVGIP